MTRISHRVYHRIDWLCALSFIGQKMESRIAAGIFFIAVWSAILFLVADVALLNRKTKACTDNKLMWWWLREEAFLTRRVLPRFPAARLSVKTPAGTQHVTLCINRFLHLFPV
jgi:hypothetical protein